MPKRTGADAFQDLLEGLEAPASPESHRMASIVHALQAGRPPGARPEFTATLRAQLVAKASMSDEDAFAAVLTAPHPVDPEFAPLAALAAALERGARRETPSPQFRFQLRNRLVAEAARPRGIAAATAAMNLRWRRSLRRVVATGMAAAMMLGGSAAMAASDGALPGDPITYSLKLVREDAQVWILRGTAEGDRLLDLAARRVTELRGLADRKEIRVPLFTGTLERMDRQTVDGTEILLKDGAREFIERVDRFAQAQAVDLEALIDRLPPGARPAARDSISIVERVERLAQDKLRGCPCADDTTNPLEHLGSPGPSDQACPCAGPGDSPRAATPGSDPGQAPPTDTSGGTGTSGSGGSGGTQDQDGPPAVDVPDLPEDTDGTVEEIVDDLLDELGVTPAPTPEPTLPPLEVPTLPVASPIVVPSLGL